ncbi:MAG: hypothetical protein ACAH17_03085 [Candidatus Paceibacterota bacterium]
MTILQINRSLPFDHNTFYDGVHGSVAENDERSLQLTEVNLTKVTFETMLNAGEQFISTAEKINRLNECGFIRLDAKVFQTLWENQHLIPEGWKEKTVGGSVIVFDGTIVTYRLGRRAMLSMYWDGEWNLQDESFDQPKNTGTLSAVVRP